MAENSLDERSLEILGIPDDFDQDLLWLYFENKRRSGGGDVESLDRYGNKVLVVFKDVEAAAGVLSKGSHALHDSRFTVRRKPPKDPGKLLLKGLHPNTGLDFLELYTENITEMECGTDFSLCLSPSKDMALIHLHKPLTKDFQMIKEKVSKKNLDGAKISLEQVESTDSISVTNLSPNTTEDMLELYFGSSRGGSGEVLCISMLAEGCAKVSFKDVKSVDNVLQKSHNLEGLDLEVKPYFDFLQVVTDQTPVRVQNGQGTSLDVTDQDGTVNSPVLNQSPTVSSPTMVTNLQKSAGPANNITNLVVNSISRSAEPVSVAARSTDVEPMDIDSMDLYLPRQKECVSFISVPDKAKHQLIGLTNLPENLIKAHPNFDISLTQDGVQIKGPDHIEVEKLKNTVQAFLSGVVQAHLTYDKLKADFLERQDIKNKLHLSLKALASIYSVSDCTVTVTSSSQSTIDQVRDLIESHISEFTVPLSREYESVLFTQECSDFLGSLDFSCAKVSDTGEVITAVTLKGMEKEKQEKIVQFLSTPIQKQCVLAIEPGMLTFLQLHFQDLLADMGAVMILPLETGHGLSIQGDLGACQMAEEVLTSIISSTCTRSIVVNQPGICRFLLEEGTNILAEMTAKFQVYINMEKVHWKPLEDNDLFEQACKMTPCQNFKRSSAAASVQNFNVRAPNFADVHTSARIEEAKKILSFVGRDLPPQPSSLGATHREEEDLYSDLGQDASAMQEDEADLPCVLQTPQSFPIPLMDCSLEEDASLSLAIQLSMEINQKMDTDDLQMALDLSRSDSIPAEEISQLEKAVEMSLEDEIRSANKAEIFVYASYNHDLVRVDIALGKKVGLRQSEEKVEDKNLRKLSSLQKRCIELIKRRCAVEISIQGTTAIVSGFKDYVSEAVNDLRNFLKRPVNNKSDAEIVNTVQWEWQEEGSAAMIPYPPDATVFIENAWKMKQMKIDTLFDNQPYTIDFERMEEHSLASGKSVPIKRKILSNDDLCTDGADEDYSLLSNMPGASKLNEDSEEFQNVVKEFYDTIQDYRNKIKIIKVEKLMNKLLYDQYKLKKASVQCSSFNPEVERTLYHGTSETSVKEICIHGFNRSFCGKNATVFGQGVYFAVNSALSVLDTYSPPNADGHKFIFMAKVLTGDFKEGKHEMKTAPLKDNTSEPIRYHSVTDKVKSPTLFVIFNDTQAYPEYLITCKKIYR